MVRSIDLLDTKIKYCILSVDDHKWDRWKFPCALKFVCIHDKSDFQKEQEYAREKEAFFWRNGRPYGTKNRN